MSAGDWNVLVEGVDFGEGPRWHEGRFWYSDFYQHTIWSVGAGGDRRAEFELPSDRPSGLGWLPDGTLLVVSMEKRQVLRSQGSDLVLHADLSELAPWHCNDMIVDARGNAYVGNFGFDLEGGVDPINTNLVLVRPDGTVETVADELGFPNGSVLTPDGSTLIVGESFGQRYTAFTVADDATLGERRVWADVPGTAPDGCTLDADGGIWFADAIGSQVVRVTEGGELTHQWPTPQPTFACMLGGDDGKTLFALTAVGGHPDQAAGSASGAVLTRRVDAPHAGRP